MEALLGREIRSKYVTHADVAKRLEYLDRNAHDIYRVVLACINKYNIKGMWKVQGASTVRLTVFKKTEFDLLQRALENSQSWRQVMTQSGDDKEYIRYIQRYHDDVFSIEILHWRSLYA